MPVDHEKKPSDPRPHLVEISYKDLLVHISKNTHEESDETEPTLQACTSLLSFLRIRGQHNML